MKKCPYCAEEIQDAAIVCRYCGRELSTKTLEVQDEANRPKKNDDLDQPLSGCVYVLIGFLFANFLPIAVYMLIYVLPDASTEMFSLLSLLVLCAVLYFATIGRYGRLSFFGVMNIIVWSAVPIANWWVAYYLGRGLHMKFSRQELHSPPTPSAVGLILSVVVLVIAWLGSSNTKPASIPPTRTPRPTLRATPTRRIRKSPTPEQSSCLPWDEVDASMVGESVCVYGIVQQAGVTNIGDGQYRIYFGRGMLDFFFLDVNYTYPDVKAGDCVSAFGTIETNMSDVPFINLHGKLSSCE